MTTTAHLPTDRSAVYRTGGHALGTVRTWANLVTLLRTVGALVPALLAAVTGNAWLLLAAYVIYWVGDMADGATARWLDQETRLGAVADIVCDRLCTAVLGMAFLAMVPGIWPVLAIFLFSFMAVDSLLSLAFLCWPLRSPNEFGSVDQRVYRLNWSPLAKATNTSVVVLLLVLDQVLLAGCVASVVLIVKLYSAHRVLRLLEETS